MKHEKAEMMGMKKGGMPMKDGKPMFMKKMNMGGMSSYAKGGGIESKGKTRRMADGGATSLPMMPEYDKGGKGAFGGLDTVRQGEGQTRKSLSNIQSELGGQGGGSGIGDLYRDLYPSAGESSGMTGGGFKKGGSIRGGGIESHGKTKGTMVRMATGGSVSSASRRADGIAQRGKTKFKNC
jgi:hypothetical protein